MDNLLGEFQYYNGREDFDVDTHNEKVSTLGVVQNGGSFSNTQEPIRHVKFGFLKETTNVAASTAVTGIADVVRISPKEVINYLIFGPSARNNDVIVSIRPIQFFNPGAVGTFFPIGDFLVRSGAGTQMFRIPTERNYTIEVYVVPPSGYAAPYSDVALIGMGYLSDGLEKVAINDGR